MLLVRLGRYSYLAGLAIGCLVIGSLAIGALAIGGLAIGVLVSGLVEDAGLGVVVSAVGLVDVAVARSDDLVFFA